MVSSYCKGHLTYEWVIEHRDIKLAQNWKLILYQLDFIVLEGAMNITGREK